MHFSSFAFLGPLRLYIWKRLTTEKIKMAPVRRWHEICVKGTVNWTDWILSKLGSIDKPNKWNHKRVALLLISAWKYTEQQWLDKAFWHVLFMGYIVKLSSDGSIARPLNPNRFFKQNCLIRKQPNPKAMTFSISAPETFKISAGDMLPWSAVWCWDAHDLTGPRASGNVRHVQVLFLCYGAGLFQVLLLWLLGFGWHGSLCSWMLRESENGCVCELLMKWAVSNKSLDQLLIKGISKLCETVPVSHVVIWDVVCFLFVSQKVIGRRETRKHIL